MRIAIVEDNEKERERIASLTRQYFEGREEECQLTLFCDGDELVERYAPGWDLIFLDIQMARLNGLAAAQMIRQKDPDVFLVFVTNMASCAIKGYGVRALDFLVKPVNGRVLGQLLRQVERLLRERRKKYIALSSQKGEFTRVSVADIDYVEVANHVLSVVTAQGTLRLRGTISALEEQLAPYDFVRCNNCYLVNLARVTRVENGMVTVGGHSLAISRPRQKKFMEALTRYIGGSESYV